LKAPSQPFLDIATLRAMRFLAHKSTTYSLFWNRIYANADAVEYFNYLLRRCRVLGVFPIRDWQRRPYVVSNKVRVL
jgi:hypothetical protein